MLILYDFFSERRVKCVEGQVKLLPSFTYCCLSHSENIPFRYVGLTKAELVKYYVPLGIVCTVTHSIRCSGPRYHCLIRGLLGNLTSDAPVKEGCRKPSANCLCGPGYFVDWGCCECHREKGPMKMTFLDL